MSSANDGAAVKGVDPLEAAIVRVEKFCAGVERQIIEGKLRSLPADFSMMASDLRLLVAAAKRAAP